ncbi:hypothetical protein ACS0TY_027068 [Phlomoides rotata]
MVANKESIDAIFEDTIRSLLAHIMPGILSTLPSSAGLSATNVNPSDAPRVSTFLPLAQGTTHAASGPTMQAAGLPSQAGIISNVVSDSNGTVSYHDPSETSSSFPAALPAQTMGQPFPNAAPASKPSYADVTHARQPPRAAPPPVPASMQPVKHGDFFMIDVDDKCYQQGLGEFKGSLIGRIMMSTGDKLCPMIELMQKVWEIWHLQGDLKLIPLARGYFTIQFSLLAERDRVYGRHHWTLNPGAIRLQPWMPEFNPNKVRTSLVQVWVHILDLPIEYWHPTILEAMGTLIKIDVRTSNKLLGHYARLLIEIDMKSELLEKLMYQIGKIFSFASIVYERLPDFCRECSLVGHAAV